MPLVQHARCKVPTEYNETNWKSPSTHGRLADNHTSNSTSKWVSSITYPCKPNGTLSICLDPRYLGKAINREHYKAQTPKEISHKLAGATIFFQIRCQRLFLSVHLDTTSSYLITFNAHKGRWRFFQMPFRLKMSLDVFQMRMDQSH